MEHENYTRLQRLLQYGRQLLEIHLGLRWKEVFAVEMPTTGNTGGDEDAIASLGLTKKLMTAQRETIIKEPPSTWDITLLTLILRSGPFRSRLKVGDNKSLSAIASVRNDLAHRASFHVDDADFQTMWEKVATALQHFTHEFNIEAELDTLKTAPIDEITGTEDAGMMANALKEQGNALFAKQKYEEASMVYTEAIQQSNISKRALAILHSNRSMCFLKLSRAREALNDATRCQQLQPNWYKPYVRLGHALMALDMPKKAAKEFDRGLQHEQNGDKRLVEEMKNLKWSAIRQSIVNRGAQQNTGLFQKREFLSIPGQEHVEKGHEYYFGTQHISKNAHKAIAEYKLGAAVGNIEALYNYATALMDSPSKPDFATAHKMLLQAAAAEPGDVTFEKVVGFDAAQYTLGINYQHGIYVSQDFAAARNWYEKAISNGSAYAANNLGLMYLDGHQGLDRSFPQAEQLFLLAYRRGEHKAASNLAGVYTVLKQPSKVKRWYNTAKSHGELPHDIEETCTRFLSDYGSLGAEAESLLAAFRPIVEACQSTTNPTSTTNASPAFDTDTLTEYASRGGGYATQLLKSQTAFESAMKMLFVHTQTDYFDPVPFIDHYFLSLKFESSGIVCKMPERIGHLVQCAVSDFIENQARSHSDTDMKARLIMASLIGLRSMPSAFSILNESIRKYPSCALFHSLRGSLHCFQEDFESGLRDFNKALELSPESYEVLYDRAIALNHSCPNIKNMKLKRRQNERVQQAYQTFIDRAPKDHRKVPAAYYAMAALYAAQITPAGRSPNIKLSKQLETFRSKGLEAENDQMHYFLPYQEGSSKRALEIYDYSIKLRGNVNSKGALPPNETMDSVASRFANCIKCPTGRQTLSRYRTELIVKHREAIAFQNERKNTFANSIADPPERKHRRSLLGLKGVVLRDLDTTKDYVATGCVLDVIIIEPPVFLVGVYFVVADENDDAVRLALYNLPGHFPANCDNFSIGTEISIVEPYVRQSIDGGCIIRVDEPSSVMMTGNQRVNMCRYCGQSNAPSRCSKCGQAAYCNRACQINDWKLLQHKKICEVL